MRILGLSLILLILGCHQVAQKRAAAQDPTKPFNLFGRVTDDHGKPISNAQVWVNSGMGTLLGHSETTTDRDGNFRVPFGLGIWFTPDNEHGEVGFQYAVVFASKSGMAETNLCRQGSLGVTD